MSHSDPRAEGDPSFGLNCVEFGQDAAGIWCQRGQDLTVTARKQRNIHASSAVM